MLYTILDIKNETDEDKIIADFILDPRHPVFEGHFPGQPVLPGVIMVQILRDIIQKNKNILIGLLRASNIKYLIPVLPVENKKLNYNIRYKSISEDQLTINADLIQDGKICMKFSGVYKVKLPA